jgi:hypothetical protein
VGRLLQEIPREELSAWLLTMAKTVPDFGKRLNLFVAQHSSVEAAMGQYRATLETLTKSRNRNPQKRAREAAQNFEGLIVSLTAEFEAGRMDIVMGVCAEGLVVLNEFLRENADPKGKLQPLVDELCQLHFMAATEMRPNQKWLANQLVEVGQEAALTRAFRDAAYQYRDVLNDAGLDSYRAALEPYWQKLLGAVRMSWHQRELTRVQMLSWARAQEDPRVRAEQTGAILAAVADTAEELLHAAKNLLRAGRDEAAMVAAGQGFALAVRTPYLHECLLDLAVLRMERSTPVEAAEIAWTAFRARPDQDGYTLLRQAALAIDAELEYWAKAAQRLAEVGSAWRPPTPAAK